MKAVGYRRDRKSCGGCVELDRVRVSGRCVRGVSGHWKYEMSLQVQGCAAAVSIFSLSVLRLFRFFPYRFCLVIIVRSVGQLDELDEGRII